eukprot:1724757-Rhodomonas_salina.2
MSGTNGAMGLRACYAMPGTYAAYDAISARPALSHVRSRTRLLTPTALSVARYPQVQRRQGPIITSGLYLEKKL